jgi:hypothetical protein
MGRKRHTSEEIIGKLHEAEIVLAQGGTSIGQIERTYFHLNDRLRITHALTGLRVDGELAA